MPRLTINNVAAPNLSGTSNILANATKSLNDGFQSASSILDDYSKGQQDSADQSVLSTIADISSEEELSSLLGSRELDKLNLSPEMRKTILNLRGTVLSNNQSREGVESTKANTRSVNASTSIRQAVEGRTANEYKDSVDARTERRNLTGLVIGANREGLQQGTNGFTIDAPASLLDTESSGGNFAASNNEIGHGGLKGHRGRVQFGQARFQEAKAAGAIPNGMSFEQFGSDTPEGRAAQKSGENWHFSDIQNRIDKDGLNKYIGQTIGGVEITRDGIVAMAHLGGFGGASQYLRTGGQYNKSDSNGVSLSDYATIHAGNTTDRNNRPAFNNLSSAISSSLKLDPGDALKIINDAYAAQQTGQNRIDNIESQRQNEAVASATIAAVNNPDFTNPNQIADSLINNPTLGSPTQRLNAGQQSSNLVGEGGILQPTLTPNVPTDEQLTVSTQLYDAAEQNKLRSSPQNIVINRANSFGEDPTQDLIEFLNIGKDGETPTSNYFFADHDPNKLRTIINDIARESKVTPQVAASAMAEIFVRDPFGNNSDEKRFNKNDAISFIRANLSQDAIANFNKQRAISESSKRQISSMQLQLNTLRTQAAKYGGNVPQNLADSINLLKNQILSITNGTQ